MTSSLAKMIAGHSPATPDGAETDAAPPTISTTSTTTAAATPPVRPKPNLFDDDPLQPPTSGGCTFVAKKILTSGRDADEDAVESGPASPAAPAVPCPDCGSSLFWESVYDDDLNCCECLTPPIAAIVRRRWLLLVDLDDDGRPRPGGDQKYLGRWQECERDAWRPVTGTTNTTIGDGYLDLADLPRDEDGRIDWWLVLDDDERRDLSTPTPESRRRRCPWCNRRASHAAWCVEMRREWGRMKIGKTHRGKILEDVPEDYLAWLLQYCVGSSDDRRMWLEELQGRDRGHEYRTPYWERMVEVA